jgi:hypothetical protein
MNKPLHDSDFFTWTRAQADALRRRSGKELDWEFLAQELDALGSTEIRELESHYRVLQMHLVKWLLQPERRVRSWRNTIMNQRDAIHDHIAMNPGFKPIEAEQFGRAYVKARRDASTEMDMDLELIPETPPFTLEQAKDTAWWPA